MELYQKCFDYIAYRREKDKTKAKFDWDLISCMMKDNTFMELARMCFPNNSDIGKNDIVNMLCNNYSGKYESGAQAERAAEEFLLFCSDRTELFVPAAGEDRFKFFHRSFFEYFYSQYIFLRIREVESVYNSLQQFDVDSEVFELTLAMMKQKDEFRYQELVEYIFDKADGEINRKGTNFIAFNILTLGMQVIDDNIYVRRYIDYLLENKERIVRNIEYIQNQWVIINVILRNDEFIQKVIRAYENNSKLEIVKRFLEQFKDVLVVVGDMKYKELSEEERKQYISRRFTFGYGNTFYFQLYIRNIDYADILSDFSENDLESLLMTCKTTKKTREKYKKMFIRYQALSEEKKELLQEALLSNPYRNRRKRE